MELRGRAEESQQLAQEVGQCDCGMMWERESLFIAAAVAGQSECCVCVCVCVLVSVCTYIHVCACVMCLDVSAPECVVRKLLWCFILCLNIFWCR